MEVPIIFLQTLKQNTEVRDDDDQFPRPPKKEIATQTPVGTPVRLIIIFLYLFVEVRQSVDNRISEIKIKGYAFFVFDFFNENQVTHLLILWRNSVQDKRKEKIFKLQEMCCQDQLGSCTVCGYPTHSLHWFSCQHIFLFFTFYW